MKCENCGWKLVESSSSGGVYEKDGETVTADSCCGHPEYLVFKEVKKCK